jgi:hypothetical protein
MTIRGKRAIAVVAFAAVTCVGLWFGYSPEHWLRQITFATVRVDDRPIQADLYIGNPTYSEAEAIVLVHVPGVGDYFLNFLDEDYREASNHEFVRLPRGIWTFRSMRVGHFVTPLPSRNLNEFRIASSNGHTVTVQF